MYDMKALYEAGSVSEAIELLTEHPEAKIIAGRKRRAYKNERRQAGGLRACEHIRAGLPGGVTLEEDGTIRIGPLTSFSHITKNGIIQKYINVLGGSG